MQTHWNLEGDRACFMPDETETWNSIVWPKQEGEKTGVETNKMLTHTDKLSPPSARAAATSFWVE